jgi:catechol 2,3-dioxygenase-like lactoylglutathione lyase family enzyme
MIVGVHHFAVNVRDFERMRRFYQEAFGFTPVDEGFAWKDAQAIDRIIDVEGSAARTTMLRAGNCYIELFEYSAPPPRASGPLKPQDRGYTHFCVDTDDMAADFERLKRCGVDFRGRDYVDINEVKTIYGYDPEGNLIELQQLAPDHRFALGTVAG